MRRQMLWGWVMYVLGVGPLCAATPYAPVVPGKPLEFPADYGSHPQFRTEWWYLTGWLNTGDGKPLGFQITFFRTKPDVADGNPSAFNPRQLLIAHCAISDPERGRLWQDQRIRRAGMGLADAAVGDTAVYIERWALRRASGGYSAKIEAEDFSLDLAFAETEPLMQNGEAGLSRKGPAAGAASYYYSLPHLRVSGHVTRGAKSDVVTGEAWLDHEWSSEYLDAQAVGWDWLGLNFDDGSAVMAFRIRGADGKQRWGGGTVRAANGQLRILGPEEVEFQERRHWVSRRTSISYPVEWFIRAGDRAFSITPLMDDQENDTRLSTGAIYWEGAVRATVGNTPVGRGYLELTGYGNRLQLP
jgi:predicted secreted hydrolase